VIFHRLTLTATSYRSLRNSLLFFFNDPATTEIYTLSLHDALPISRRHIDADRLTIRRLQVCPARALLLDLPERPLDGARRSSVRDRKSTRLNSSHVEISYAVFCLKKKKKNKKAKHQQQEENVSLMN